jgi:hypothetical protein
VSAPTSPSAACDSAADRTFATDAGCLGGGRRRSDDVASGCGRHTQEALRRFIQAGHSLQQHVAQALRAAVELAALENDWPVKGERLAAGQELLGIAARHDVAA